MTSRKLLFGTVIVRLVAVLQSELSGDTPYGPYRVTVVEMKRLQGGGGLPYQLKLLLLLTSILVTCSFLRLIVVEAAEVVEPKELLSTLIPSTIHPETILIVITENTLI